MTGIDDKTVFMTGGSRDIYRLTCDSATMECEWTLHDLVKAKRARSGHIAVIVPNEFCVPR